MPDKPDSLSSRPGQGRALGCLLAAGLIAASAGCSGAVDVTADWQGAIPADPLYTADPTPTELPLGVLSLPIEEYLSQVEQEGISLKDVRSVRIARAALDVAGPPGATLDFLQNIDVDIIAPHLPTVRIAHLDSVPRGVSKVTLDIDDVELLSYIQSEAASITPSALGNLPPVNTTVSGTVVLEILPAG